MKLPCAWCIKEKNGKFEKESHGICDEHKEKIKKEYEDLKKVRGV